MGYGRIETPTREQWLVAAWMTIVVLGAMGAVGLWYEFNAPPDKAEAGRQLIATGAACWALAAGVWGVKRAAELFVG